MIRFQPRNRVSLILLKINPEILERNPVSQSTACTFWDLLSQQALPNSTDVGVGFRASTQPTI